jgi:hypothetical protein
VPEGIYLKAYFYAAGLLALAASHWYAYESGADNREAHVQNQYLKDYTVNLQAARDKERSLQAQLKKAQDGYVSRQSVLLADGVRARADAARLRDELSDIQRRLPSLTEQAVRRYTAALGIVFGQCTERLGTLAEDAGRVHNAAVTLDQAWPQ